MFTVNLIFQNKIKWILVVVRFNGASSSFGSVSKSVCQRVFLFSRIDCWRQFLFAYQSIPPIMLTTLSNRYNYLPGSLFLNLNICKYFCLFIWLPISLSILLVNSIFIFIVVIWYNKTHEMFQFKRSNLLSF